MVIPVLPVYPAYLLRAPVMKRQDYDLLTSDLRVNKRETDLLLSSLSCAPFWCTCGTAIPCRGRFSDKDAETYWHFATGRW